MCYHGLQKQRQQQEVALQRIEEECQRQLQIVSQTSRRNGSTASPPPATSTSSSEGASSLLARALQGSTYNELSSANKLRQLAAQHQNTAESGAMLQKLLEQYKQSGQQQTPPAEAINTFDWVTLNPHELDIFTNDNA